MGPGLWRAWALKDWAFRSRGAEHRQGYNEGQHPGLVHASTACHTHEVMGEAAYRLGLGKCNSSTDSQKCSYSPDKSRKRFLLSVSQSTLLSL